MIYLPSIKNLSRHWNGGGCSVGTTENSPAFQRRVGEQPMSSPAGTAEFFHHKTNRNSFSIVPSGLNFISHFPGVETPGYFQMSLPGRNSARISLTSHFN